VIRSIGWAVVFVFAFLILVAEVQRAEGVPAAELSQ